MNLPWRTKVRLSQNFRKGIKRERVTKITNSINYIQHFVMHAFKCQLHLLAMVSKLPKFSNKNPTPTRMEIILVTY